MIRVHKICLDTTPEQEDYFRRACGVARQAYNVALAEWQWRAKAGLKPNEADLRKQYNAVKEELYPWALEVTKSAPQQAIKNLGKAYSNAYARLKKGTKRGRKNPYGFPNFKKKGVRDSFRADNGPADDQSDAVVVDGASVVLPLVGTVRMREALRFAGRVKSATVSRAADGWYVALSVDTDQRLKSNADIGPLNAVGVDLGLTKFATTSDDRKDIPTLKSHRAAHKRLVRLSRSLSRKVKGSHNRAKAKTKLARLHLRIANIRKDALHKLTTTLATKYSLIGIEDLNVSGMMGGTLARSVADAGFAEFRRQLEYKCDMAGAKLVIVDRFFPSSQLFSQCDEMHPEMTFKGGHAPRMVCRCGCDLDRDLNAAINIRRQALACQSVEGEALASAQAETKLRPQSREPACKKQKITDRRSYAQT